MKLIMTLLLGMFFICSSTLANEIKIGVIDLQKAIQATSAGKKAKHDLEEEISKRKKDISKKEDELKKMHEEFQKKQSVLSDEVAAQKQNELQGEMVKYRELMNKTQMELQKKEMDLTKPIVEKLRGIVDSIAKAENYTMIMEKSEQGVVWSQKDIDLTDKVVQEFEKSKN